MGIASGRPRTAGAIAAAGFVWSSDPSPNPATAPLEVVLEGCTLRHTDHHGPELRVHLQHSSRVRQQHSEVNLTHPPRSADNGHYVR